MFVDTWECMPLTFTVVAIVTVLDWRMVPQLAGAGKQADSPSWLSMDCELLRSPAETSFRPLCAPLISAEGMAGGVECSRPWARAALTKEGTVSVIGAFRKSHHRRQHWQLSCLVTLSPPFPFFSPLPLLTILKVFETIVDHHSIIFEVAALAVDKNAREVGSGVAK